MYLHLSLGVWSGLSRLCDEILRIVSPVVCQEKHFGGSGLLSLLFVFPFINVIDVISSSERASELIDRLPCRKTTWTALQRLTLSDDTEQYNTEWSGLVCVCMCVCVCVCVFVRHTIECESGPKVPASHTHTHTHTHTRMHTHTYTRAHTHTKYYPNAACR